MQDQVFSYAALHHYACRVFLSMGCPDSDAKLAADVLLQADARGIDSHGIARLSGYWRLYEAGRINPTPNIQVVHETPSTAVVDGDSGLGLVVAPVAMRIAIAKAEQVGSGWVSVRNSNHFGIAGYHAMLALEQDMIGWAMTNASALVAPTFSRERMLGTNPFCIAIPAGEEPAFVADFATTTAANGKLEILQRKGADTPDGWVIDGDGAPSQDANILKKGGLLLPLGSDREHGSHKGYAMGSVVDILSAVLSGASYGPWAPPFPAYVPMPENMPGVGLGHFLGAMRIDGFRPAAEFKHHMDQWIRRFRGATPIDPAQPVLVPGDPERETAALRMVEGIPLVTAVVSDLQQLSEKTGLDFPAANAGQPTA